MKKIYLISLLVIIFFSCMYDRYEIKRGARKKIFVSMSNDNFMGHLFWYNLRTENGKIRFENNRRTLFDKKRDTIIFIHGWQGTGPYGWTTHSIMTDMRAYTGPVELAISVIYNVPSYGATFPTVKERVKNYNVAAFDWQMYNNIADVYETTENLSELERNIKFNPDNWPNIPKNLAEEIKLFVESANYEGKIYLVAHSLGNQVVLRTYNILEDNLKEKIEKVILLDPFSTRYFDYMNNKIEGDYHWLTGMTTIWIKDDLAKVMLENDILDKLNIIISTDIGKAWVKDYSDIIKLPIIDDEYEEIQIFKRYRNQVRKKHDDLVDDFYLYKKYDEYIGIKK